MGIDQALNGRRFLDRAGRATGGQSQNDFPHHLSPQRRATSGDEPIYHSFRAIANSSNVGTRQGLARYDLTTPVFIGTTIGPF